jgi:hypothetical protein
MSTFSISGRVSYPDSVFENSISGLLKHKIPFFGKMEFKVQKIGLR